MKIITPFERRKHRRFNFDATVYEKERVLGCTGNISLEGCFIQTEHPVSKPILYISFELPDTLEEISLPCQVVRNTARGIGTKFIMDYVHSKIIHRFIQRLSKKSYTQQMAVSATAL